MSVAIDGDEPIGTRLGSILVERRLAEGGMGTVYLGRDERLQRAVAIKSISRELRTDPESRGRFLREAQVLSRLKHPNICEIYGYEDSADSAYLVLEYIDGRSLRTLIDSGVGDAERDRIALTLAEVLRLAHGAGVVHRDLKPENVMLTTDGEVKVLDFGIARLVDDSAVVPPADAAAEISVEDSRSARTLPTPRGGNGSPPSATRAGALVGTPRYMSPEQARGESATPACDVYALGLILHELYTGLGVHPPDLDGPALIARLIGGKPLLPSAVRGPRMRLIARMLASEARDRPTATEVAQGFRRIRDRPRRLLLRGAAVLGVALAVLAATKYLVDVRAAVAHAERTVTAQFVEHGRSAILAGDHLRALVYLSEAFGRGADDVATRFMLGRATRMLDKEVASVVAEKQVVFEISPDGRTLATAGHGNVELWDVRGHLLRRMSGHEGRIHCMRWSPQGALVTGGDDGTVRVWAADTGFVRAVLRGHTAEVLKLRVLSDGRILTGSSDRTVRLWDVASGTARILATLPMYPVAFGVDVDGRTAAYATREGVALIDLASGAVRPLTSPQDLALIAEFSPDGKRLLVTGYDGSLQLFDVATARELYGYRGHNSAIWRVQWSSDGTRFVTASQDRTARVWDAANGRLIASLAGHHGAINTAEFDAAGSRVVTASTDGTSEVWDAATGRPLSRLVGHNGEVRRASFTPDGTRVITVGADATLRFWNPVEDDLIGDLIAPAPWGAAFAGQLVALVEENRDVTLRDPVSGDEVRRFSLGEPEAEVEQPYQPAVSPDGLRIATLGHGSVVIWDADSGARLVTIPLAGPRDLAFSPDGRRLLVIAVDGPSGIFDPRTGALLAPLRAGGHALAWRADGRAVAVANSDREEVTLWDANSGARTGVLEKMEGVQAVAFSPDGQLLAAGLDTREARIWRLADGTLVRRFNGHVDQIDGVAFSPDQRFLATASYDGTARIWDVASGAQVYVLAGHTGFVFTAMWSPDGETLLTASNDGHVRTWDVALERRSPAQVARLVSCRVPFQLVEGQLAPGTPTCR